MLSYALIQAWSSDLNRRLGFVSGHNGVAAATK
jgi:hypothetical protein